MALGSEQGCSRRRTGAVADDLGRCRPTAARPHAANHGSASLVWFGESPLVAGRSYILRTETDQVSVTVTELARRIGIAQPSVSNWDQIPADRVIAVEAALTGHLVLTTLHTNDAASTPMRLVEMGVEPFLVTSALDCVLAQRLARRLCENCREAYQPSEYELQEAGWPMEGIEVGEWPTLYRPVGCTTCGRTGYRGRFAIHEVMPISRLVAVSLRRKSGECCRSAADEGRTGRG